MNKPKNIKAKKQKNSDNKNLIMFLLPLIVLLSALFVTSGVSSLSDIGKHLNFPVITVIFSFCTFSSRNLVN